MINQYSLVRLNSDKYQSEGIEEGSKGYIVDIFDGPHYYVEFSEPDGSTIALLTLTEDEIQLLE